MTQVAPIDIRISPATRRVVEIEPRNTAATNSERRVPGAPFAVPRSQLYYWTKVWQDGVAVAHEAIARGDFVDFDSDDPNDVVRWLFEVDEDE